MLTLFEHKSCSSSDIYPVDLPFRFKLTLSTEHCTFKQCENICDYQWQISLY